MSRKLDTSKMFYREMKIEQESVSEDERSFEISFSSETPVPRWGTDEILDHSAGAVDLSRLQTMGILLFNHNRDKVLGRVENARVENGRGLAKIIFDDDEDSLKIFQKVQSGTLRGISVGYVDLDYTYIPENTMSADGRFKGECFLVTRWQPLEVSVVSVPADASVGIERSMQDDCIAMAVKRALEEERGKFRLEMHKAKLASLM